MEPETYAERRAVAMNKWWVGLGLGLWAVACIVIAFNYVNTGGMSDTSIVVLLVGVGSLLDRASDATPRRVLRWLLRSGTAAAWVGAFYVFLRGGWLARG